MSKLMKMSLFAGGVLAILGAGATWRWWKDPVYDFYYPVEQSNCDSPFEKDPFSLTFRVKREDGEVFRIAVFRMNNETIRDLDRLENCSVLDKNNWKCGGVSHSTFVSDTYSMVDGSLTYTNMYNLDSRRPPLCPPKIIKR
jgi:hypothetical protein